MCSHMRAKRLTLAILAGSLISVPALTATSASGAATTVAIKLAPNPPPLSSQVKLTVSGTIGAPGTFEVADFLAPAGVTCTQALVGPALEFGAKITHLLSAEGPFLFEGSFRTSFVSVQETLCAIVFPDPRGVLREESSGPLIVPSATAELRYLVGGKPKPKKHCRRTRHRTCRRTSRRGK
jgi:hypothetical protein